MKKKNHQNDELNLSEILNIIWKGKIQIFLITILFVIIVFTYHLNNKPKILAISEVMPITIFEEEFYSSYNSLINLINTEVDYENIKKGKDVEKDRNKINSHSEIIFNIIDKEFLLELFIEEIQSKDILVEAI